MWLVIMPKSGCDSDSETLYRRISNSHCPAAQLQLQGRPASSFYSA